MRMPKPPYKFEPHVHTAESSGCSAMPAKQLVRSYHAAGFDGVAITDHIHDYMLSCFKGKWDLCIDYFLKGYKKAKKHGRKLGINIILGAELRFDRHSSDYLVYGMDEDFLRAHPFINRLTPREFFKRHGNDLLIIQAHPFRNGDMLSDPSCIHGLEVFNGNPNHSNRNGMAKAFYKAHPKLLPFSASDAHDVENVGMGWLELEQSVADSHQFQDLVRRQEYSLGKQD